MYRCAHQATTPGTNLEHARGTRGQARRDGGGGFSGRREYTVSNYA